MDNSSRSKPDFIIIGSMKSGTTSLYSDMSTHRDIFLPSDKEPQILNIYDDINLIKNAYRKHFTSVSKGQICGEASTAYTYRPIYNVVNRAFDLCGLDIKLIMIMRDPLERLYSHLRHDIAGKHVKLEDVNTVVLQDSKYVQISDYYYQLQPWIDKFGKERVLCISFNDYKKNRIAVLEEVARFLKINPDYYDIKIHSTPKNRSTDLRYSSKTVNRLIDTSLYQQFIKPYLSNGLRNRIKKLLSSKVATQEFELDKKTIDTLTNKLAHVESGVESLIDRKIDIFTS